MITGFNTAPELYPYDRKNLNGCRAFKKALPGCKRFPGGTVAKYYKIRFNGAGNKNNVDGNDPQYDNVNIANRNVIYATGRYNGYNNTSNIIWPFINTETDNLMVNGSAAFVANTMCFYRLFDGSIAEIFLDHKKLDNINSGSQFFLSTFSPTFKQNMRDILDAFTALVKNKMFVPLVELGNEMYMHFSDAAKFSFAQDQIIYSRNGSQSDFTLSIYAKLLRVIRLLIAEIKPDTLFGVPITPLVPNSGFAIWNNYFINPAVCYYIGIDYYVFHFYPLADHTGVLSDSNANALENDFSIMVNSLYNNYFKWFENEFPKMIDMLPVKKVALTEYCATYGEPAKTFLWITTTPETGNRKLGNTLAAAMLYAQQQMLFLKLNKDVEKIIAVFYHAAANGIATDYPLIRMNADTNYVDPLQLNNYTINYIKYSSAYYIHNILNPLLANAKFETHDSIENYDEFYFSVPTGIIICFINRSKTARLFPFPAGLYGRAEYLQASNLYASFGKTTFRSNDSITKDPNITIQYQINQAANTAPAMAVGAVYIAGITMNDIK